jgi:alanine dehydrogenase
MIIGVPKEIKSGENRVALQPSGAETLCADGHEVLVQSGAGSGSSFEDADYLKAGAGVIASPEEIFARADMILKVKEPLPQEYGLLREEQILFTYLHLAASSVLTRALRDSGVTALGYETVTDSDGSLPLLLPMSAIAGRMAVHQGAKYLERHYGGRGVLMSGVPGVDPAEVLILGAGNVGSNAARIASGLGASVYVLDISVKALRRLDELELPNVTTLQSGPSSLKRMIARADVLISGVLVQGAKAPCLVSRELLRTMKRGAVAVDVAIDQGGSFETSRPTTHDDPVFIEEGVVHYCVANMPGALPRTATMALTNSTLPYIRELASKGLKKAVDESEALRNGVNVCSGCVYRLGKAVDEEE